MSATYPDLCPAVGVHSGSPRVGDRSAFSLRGDAWQCRFAAAIAGVARVRRPSRVRTIVFHGDADKIVHPSNAAGLVGGSKVGESIDRAETRSSAGQTYTRSVIRDQSGVAVVEQWLLHGCGHAWSGGSPDGSYTDPHGPDASREMLRFFLEGPDSRP
jgi:poly(3-hydroxybutyrate) depolymerase